MTQTTTVTPEQLAKAVETGEWSPELLAFAMQAVTAKKEAEKAQREVEKRENQKRFERMHEEVALYVAAIQEQEFALQTWYKRVKGVKTEEINGVGFYVSGTQTLNIGGVMREVRVSTFVKWSPDGKAAPADIVGEE